MKCSCLAVCPVQAGGPSSQWEKTVQLSDWDEDHSDRTWEIHSQSITLSLPLSVSLSHCPRACDTYESSHKMPCHFRHTILLHVELCVCSANFFLACWSLMVIILSGIQNHRAHFVDTSFWHWVTSCHSLFCTVHSMYILLHSTLILCIVWMSTPLSALSFSFRCPHNKSARSVLMWSKSSDYSLSITTIVCACVYEVRREREREKI